MRTILITGGAGFIGSSLSERLLSDGGFRVISIDNFDPFYDRALKEQNIAKLFTDKNYLAIEGDILYIDKYLNWTVQIDAIVHLAAKSGVRPSLADSAAYLDVNLKGTQAMLDFARSRGITQFIYASSSSVYGINDSLPWKETDTLRPISPYACSKAAAEMLGHTYAYLYALRFIALRFFTVYGPRQRPDLAIQKFLTAVLNNEPVEVLGTGDSQRDYTYIDDAIESIIASLHYTKSGYEVFNIGSQAPVSLNEVIMAIKFLTNTNMLIKNLPAQPEDVRVTFADISKAQELLNYIPQTNLSHGLLLQYNWLLTQSEGTVN